MVECAGGLFAIVLIDFLEAVPHFHIVRKAHHRLKLGDVPGGGLGRAHDDRVEVQHSADPDHVHAAIGRTHLQRRPVNPVPELLALIRAADRLVVLDVVKKQQVRPERAMPTAPDLLGRAQAFDPDIVARDDLALAPQPPLSAGVRKIVLQADVRGQLSLDRLDQQRRLLIDVANLDDVALQAEHDAIERKPERQMGGFGGAAGSDEQISDTLFRGEDLRHPRKDVLVEQAMIPAHIVRQVGFHEELEPVLLCHAGKAGQPGGRIGGKGFDIQFDVPGEIVRHFRDLVAEVFPAEGCLQLGAPGHRDFLAIRRAASSHRAASRASRS